MRDLTDRALDTATALGASYADVRVIRRIEESINIKSTRVEGVQSGETEGFGVRVLVDGAWGFAASHHLSTAEADRTAADAVRIAKASATALRNAVRLDDRPPANGSFETPVDEDPFAVPLETKIANLLAADREMNRVSGIAFTESLYSAQREWKTFAASDGSFTEQTITHVGAGLEANAIAGDEHQRRSFPDNGGLWASAGYEFVRGMDLEGNAARIASEAVELLSAPPLPAGTRTILLHPSQLYMQVHESCGHPTELDRAFGTEASYAGTSFLTPDMLGGFRYGSDLVNIVADATVAGGLGTFGWDDEGVAAQRVDLVKDGMFVGYLSSRETAPRIGRRSGGAMRADGWNRIPLIRMTNVNLLPRDGMTFDDIIADTDDGLLFETNRSWSIDDRRLNFQFATEICREIKGGKPGKLYRNGTYTGSRYELWRLDGRHRRRVELADVGHAQLRQGRAGPDGPRRARRLGRAVPQRPGGGDGMSAEHGIGGDPEEALRLAERVIQAAEAAGAGEAEALVAAGESALTRFANSEIHQNVASNEAFVNLRFVKGRRVGVASSGRVDDEGVRALVERAAAIAANVEELDDWAGLPSADPPADAPRRLVRGHRAREPRAARRGRARGHRRVRRGRRHRVRLVLDRGRGHRRRQLQGHPRRRAPHERRSC